MGRQGYPAEFRARAVALIEGGKRIRDLAHELGVSEQTLYTWRKQARVDRGETSGLTTSEKAELATMRKRVRELEAEVAVHRRASELLTRDSLPKPDTRRSR
jgi:transposase-like protein